MLGRIRLQVRGRLSHLCESDGRYLNVDHVRLQLEHLDTLLDAETLMIAEVTENDQAL